MKKFVFIAVALLLASCAGRGRAVKSEDGADSTVVEQIANVAEPELSETRVIDPSLVTKVDVVRFKNDGIIGIESVDPFCIEAYEPLNAEDYNPEDGGLNAIRFDHWNDEKWGDNNYIRSVRLYIDSYRIGALADEELDKCRTEGDFVLYAMEPFLAGGAYVSVVFIDNPQDIISFWVYSFIDWKENGEVDIPEAISGYDVRSASVESRSSGFTTQSINILLAEHPDIKRW